MFEGRGKHDYDDDEDDDDHDHDNDNDEYSRCGANSNTFVTEEVHHDDHHW